MAREPRRRERGINYGSVQEQGQPQPLAYAELILNGDPQKYLKEVTNYKDFNSRLCP